MISEDVRYALRQFRKAPGFTVTAVLSLALGIGANTAIFSVINAVLRHPAGVNDPERVAIMSVRYRQFNLDVPFVSVPDAADAMALKEVEAGALERDTSFNTTHGDEAQHLSAAQVTWRWFQVFGANPILGRTFAPEEDQPGAGSVAVISYRLWQSNFGGQPDVVGKTVLLDQKPYRVIGVMRSDFDWPRAKQVWTPLALPRNAYSPQNRFNENYQTVLRLRPGVSVQRLNAGLALMKVQLQRQGTSSFAERSGWSVYSTHLADYAAGPLRKALYVLFGVVALVLLIAAANVAGLFLARASSRSKEFAVRIALGASAVRMVKQSLTEALLLAGLATAVGIAAGPFLGRLLLAAVPGNLGEGFNVQLQPAVLTFTAAVGLVTALITGVSPALKTVQQRGRLQLHETGRSNTVSVEKQRLRSAFVIGEVALAFVLLTGTGLFLASFRQLQQVKPGFNARGVLAGELFFSGDAYKNSARQAAFIDSVVEKLARQPGVETAAAIDPLPFSGRSGSSSFEIEGRPTAKNDPGPHSQIRLGTANLLHAMQIPLLAGRWFTSGDRANTQPVVVIDARLAHRYWPNENPLGKHVRMGDNEPWSTVIGIVGDIRFDWRSKKTRAMERGTIRGRSPTIQRRISSFELIEIRNSWELLCDGQLPPSTQLKRLQTPFPWIHWSQTRSPAVS